MFSHIFLKPSVWHQEIRHVVFGKGEGRCLRATCTPTDKCDLVLNNGAKLRDFEIDIGIIRGELTSDARTEYKLGKEAIGGLKFIKELNCVHGWFYFRLNNHEAVWDQVRAGGYFDCTIFLNVEIGSRRFGRRSFFN